MTARGETRAAVVGMRRAALVLALAAGGCGAAPAASGAGRDVFVDRPLPAPPSATLDPGPVPYAGAAWVEPHWEWDGLSFVWVDGYWIDLSAGPYVLHQPRWTPEGGGVRFTPGALERPDGTRRALPAPPRGGSGSGGRATGTIIVVPP